MRRNHLKTQQQIYDFVKKQLIKQGQPSIRIVHGEVRCLYRGPNKTACGIGHLIGQKYYRHSFEGNNVEAYQILWAIRASVSLPAGAEIDLSFLTQLQQAHDQAAEDYHYSKRKKFLPTLQKNLKQYVAKPYGLKA